jgi:Gas vesicle synthesis protein GvpL/GvpF
VIWVYAICDRPDLPPPRRRGLAQAPLEGLCEGPLQAIFTRHAGGVGEPAPDALWAHERVVERLMADRAVLPMRFGSRVTDDDALRRVLTSGSDQYVAALARVSGRVELGVRALARNGAAEPVPAGVTGREYVMAKLNGGRRAEGEAAALHAPLAALSADARRQPPRGSEELLRGAYLVDRLAVARFRAAVERLQAGHPEAAILCTGPWPPYSFAA